MTPSHIPIHDPLYPQSVLQRMHKPVPLFVACNDWVSLQHTPMIAIVGSRRPTSYGRQVTALLARDLAQAGITIVSGLAFGVDAAAHAATLDAGGKAVAVLPTPLERISPISNRNLARRMVEQGGALISSYPPDADSHRGHFVARNEIVAALSSAVVITEATARSGSLHTAKFALDMGLPVYAVPGNINSPLSEGTNRLIAAGATPVCSGRDLLRHVGMQPAGKPSTTFEATPEGRILKQIHNGVHDGGQLLAASKLNASSFNQALTMLEIQGRVRAAGGNQWLLGT